MAHQKVDTTQGECTPLLITQQQSYVTTKREVIGLILVAGYALVTSTAAALVKVGAHAFPSSQIVFSRSVIQTTLGLIGCLWIRVPPLGQHEVRKWVLLRGLVGASALVLGYYSLVYLPLSDFTVMMNLETIFAAILAAIVLQEPFGWYERACLIACMVGTVIVTKPTFLFGRVGTDDDPEGGDSVGYSTHLPAVLAVLVSALLSAVAYVIIRKAGPRAHFLNYVLAFGAAGVIVSGLKFQDFCKPKETYQYFVLGSIGVLSFVGQSFINLGLQMVRTGPGTLMLMNETVFVFLYGVFIFQERPDTLSILGAIMIVGASVALGLKKK
ncbi:hypothetical protein BJV82DRAFT_710467 [Fennellomyces sp. T-0311]|nr:hypothetical protein BJV82DRAFT_710467 [Fennellomyces sp. T-0311]